MRSQDSGWVINTELLLSADYYEYTDYWFWALAMPCIKPSCFLHGGSKSVL